VKFSDLLQISTISDYYFSISFGSLIDAIIDTYNLPEVRGNELLDLLDAILDQEVTVTEAPEMLIAAFGIDGQVAKNIVCDLIGKSILPLAEFVPGLEADLRQLGANMQTYPSTRIHVTSDDFLGFIKQRLQELDVSLDDVLAKRLWFLLQQYAQQQKTAESVKTYFTRATSIGGLSLSPELSESVFTSLSPLASIFNALPPATDTPASGSEPTIDKLPEKTEQLMSEDAIIPGTSHDLTVIKDLEPKPLPPPVAPTTSSIAPKPTSVAKSLSISSPEAEAIIKAAASESVAPKVPVTDQLQGAPVTTQSQPAVRVTPVTTKPPITNAIQTPAKASEIAPDKADLKLPAKKAEEAKKIVAPVKDSLSAAIELATNQARETLKKTKISEKVFMDSAEKAIKGMRDIYQTRDLVEREWKLAGADLAAVMQAVTVGIEAYHQALPKAEAPKPVVQPTSVSDQAHLDEKFAHITQASSEKLVPPVKAQLTVGSANLQNQDGQRKMVDVVNTPRLMGPIEQLGTMTPMEFRRLSSNPVDACQKVEDLLAALETTSYEDRIQGVMAWRDSPVNQLYLSIAQEAITQSLALPEVSSRRRTAGQYSLSPAEIKALALLNAKIRF
jgi:hypothetical protein